MLLDTSESGPAILGLADHWPADRELLVTLGGGCLSQFHPQGLPQDTLSRVIHLVGWALPLRPEISPSLHHSWVRSVTPHHVTSSGTGPGTLPAYQPSAPGRPILGLTYQAGLSWEGGSPHLLCWGKSASPPCAQPHFCAQQAGLPVHLLA